MGILEAIRLYFGELTENHVVLEIVASFTCEPLHVGHLVTRFLETLLTETAYPWFCRPFLTVSLSICLCRSFVHKTKNIGHVLGGDAPCLEAYRAQAAG